MEWTTWRRTAVVVVIAGCAHPRAPRPLPDGVVADCYLEPCQATGDLDGDQRLDTVELVARGGQRGLAVRWGGDRPTLLLGAGTATAVVELGDEETAAASLAGAHPATLEADLGFLQAWRLRDRLPASLPPGRGPAIELSGGDAAWVVYLGAGGDLYYAPLGF